MAVTLRHTGRSRKRQKRVPMSEINVTPLVDVMLVLLVIFMITAPLLTFGVPVDLPEMATSKLVAEKEGPPSLEVSVNRRKRGLHTGDQGSHGAVGAPSGSRSPGTGRARES